MIAIIIRAIKNAFGVSVGVTIGGTLLPRLLHPENYESAPPLFEHLWQNFSVVFVVIFAIWVLVYIVQDWINEKNQKKDG